MLANREVEKKNWDTIKAFIPLPKPGSPNYHRDYMAATRKIAQLSKDPGFNAAVNRQRVSFITFLLEYEIVLNPKVKEFLNRDMTEFIKKK